MRKRIVERLHPAQPGAPPQGDWLDLARIATVEVTSEDAGFPIESAFATEDGPGWRAAGRGEQQIRIVFDQPVPLHRIHLRFHEEELERTQQFTLRWLPPDGGAPAEIVRQQWNFSPAGSTWDVEDYVVNLNAVAALELTIQPDVSGREAVATLASWRVS